MATAEATPIKHAAQAGVVKIAGKIENVTSFNNGGFATQVMLPAEDQYSMPAHVEIRSDKRLGSKGEEIDVLCAISGWPRKWSKVDKETGEQRSGTSINMVLRAVE